MKCPECNIKMEEKDVEIRFTNITKIAKGFVCPECRLTLIPEKESDRILREFDEGIYKV